MLSLNHKPSLLNQGEILSPVISTRGGVSAGAYGWGAAASGPVASFESIATVTAAGGETNLTFSSIAGTYTHLQIRGIVRDTIGSASVQQLAVRFNSDTGTNYGRHYLSGDASSATASGTASGNLINLYLCAPGDSMTANVFGAVLVDVLDYASTTKYKTLRGLSGADINGSGNMNVTSGVWMNTAAITSVTMNARGSAFKAGSTFALYGIKAAA